MKKYKKLLLFFYWIFLLVALATLQISFFNNFIWGFNLILLFVIFLILNKKNKLAIFSAFISGLFLNTAYFSQSGMMSIILLIISAILMILYKNVFFALKSENVFFMGIIAVFSYHILSWLIAIFRSVILSSSYESLTIYILNWKFLFELIITALFLLLIIFIKNNNDFYKKITS